MSIKKLKALEFRAIFAREKAYSNLCDVATDIPRTVRSYEILAGWQNFVSDLVDVVRYGPLFLKGGES